MNKNLTAFGRVSTINKSERTATVIREDIDIVTGDLIILNRGDNWFPEIGDYVACLFLSNNDGFILGTC